MDKNHGNNDDKISLCHWMYRSTSAEWKSMEISVEITPSAYFYSVGSVE